MTTRNQLVAKLGLGLVMSTSLLLTPNLARAATYYVTTTGNNSNPGTLASPWRTLGYGVSRLQGGDTLYIRGGTYPEAINNGIPSGTSWANATTIAAYPSETVELRPATDTFSVIGIDTPNNVQYVIFDRLILNGINTSQQTIYLGNGANHIRVQNSEVKNSGADGIAVFWGGNHLSPNFNEFINLDVHNTGLLFTVGLAHGFYITGSNTLVERCVIHDNVGYGIQIYASGDMTTNNNILRRNRISNSGTGHVNSPVGIVLSGGSGDLVYDNVIYGNYGGGILIAFQGVNAARVYHNTIYNNTGPGISIGQGTNIVRNNIVYQNSSPITDNGVGTILSNNLLTDPAFVNVAALDFHLKPGSAAIDAGVTIAEVSIDFDNTSRPQGSANDIGAYEYVTAGSPLVPHGFHIAG